MRLWHIDLITKLPRQQLLGQHRECCALRGKGWGKRHSTVDYVFKYPYYMLFNYHRAIMYEMYQRDFKPNEIWFDVNYRGKKIGHYEINWCTEGLSCENYPEHDSKYLIECIENLKAKGVII